MCNVIVHKYRCHVKYESKICSIKSLEMFITCCWFQLSLHKQSHLIYDKTTALVNESIIFLQMSLCELNVGLSLSIFGAISLALIASIISVDPVAPFPPLSKDFLKPCKIFISPLCTKDSEWIFEYTYIIIHLASYKILFKTDRNHQWSHLTVPQFHK